MALRIYKSGQGYWTRMMTAVGGGILVIAGAWWIHQQIVSIGNTSQTVEYASWGVALLPVLIFGFLIYKWVGIKPATCDFMIATEGEMKKVNWPSRKEVVGSTWIVICCVFLMAALLFAADFMFSSFFRWIKVLDLPV
jgi:preprotein translocase subunit SecE